MLSMLLAGIFMVFAVNVYQFSTCYMGVERAYLGLYKGLIEGSVITFDEEGMETRPFFYLPLLQQNVSSHFERSLKHIAPYSFSIESYSSFSGAIDTEMPDLIYIHFSSAINNFYSFNKTAMFQIAEGVANG